MKYCSEAQKLHCGEEAPRLFIDFYGDELLLSKSHGNGISRLLIPSAPCGSSYRAALPTNYHPLQPKIEL